MQFNIDLLFAAFCQFCVESRLFWPILDKKKHRLDWTIDDRNTDWQKDKKSQRFSLKQKVDSVPVSGSISAKSGRQI